MNGKALVKSNVSSVQKYAFSRVLSIYFIIIVFFFMQLFKLRADLFLIAFLIIKTLIDLNGHVIKHNDIAIAN